MQSKRIVAVLTVCILSVLVISGTSEVSAIEFTPNELNAGPYVDRIVYKVIEDSDQRIRAILDGEIEMDTGFFEPNDLMVLGPTGIEFHSALRNGYGQFTINCRDYPLNISGLRRAFAFAFDKTQVTIDVLDGFSQEHDSLVPYANSWCVEDYFDWHYYSNQADIGNQILDDLGFEINETTGFRDAPNGESFNIRIEYATGPVQLTSIEYETPYEIAIGVAQIGVEALHSLHIDAEMRSLTQYGINRIHLHGNYDIVFYSTNFYDYDVDWLGYDYWSEYADIEYQNPSNFANDTYDGWRNQLLHSTNYEGVYEAAAEMQKILHYNVPRLVVYENRYLQGYRNDYFTGHVEDLGRYIAGPWTMRKIHKLDGTFGGTVPIAIGVEPDTFNIYHPNSTYSAAILENLYSSLYKRDPNLNPWPDIAANMLTETHSDNPAVPDGHTRFTIDVIRNATWSDGVPLSAEDVAFSITYAFESGTYGNPASTDIGALIAAYAPTPYIAVIEFSTESYWHFSTFAYDYIIPEHIFNDDTGIGYENWEFWNPVFNSSHPHVTSGPYVLTDYEAGEFYEISRNDLYHYQLVPFIEPIADITYQVGTMGNEIVWTALDNAPDTYSIYMNEESRDSGYWINGVIRHNIDGLAIGNYTFTLNVFDYSGNSANSSVRVSVVDNTETTTTGIWALTPMNVLVLSICSGSIVIILMSLISIYRTKSSQEPT